jgi:hypothetical protein
MVWRIPSFQPLLACLAIGVIACGAPPPEENARQEPAKAPMNTERACELLTKADAQSILASPIEDDVDESSPTPLGDKVLHGRCYYDGDGGSVALDVSKHIDAAFAGERFARLRNRHDTDPSFRAMSGLGEGAFAEHDSLHVKRGDLILSIELRRKGERKLKHYGDQAGLDTLAAEKREIAVEVLKRLPPAVTRS